MVKAFRSSTRATARTYPHRFASAGYLRVHAASPIIADDPDAPRGTWVHWVVYGIAPGTADLPEGYAADLPGGAAHGTNDFGDQGYGGPCPPGGRAHRYFFKVYALDKEVGLNAGATKADRLSEMEAGILDSGQLMGTYRRR